MKLKKKIVFFVFVFIIGGLGGVIANRYVFPYLASTKPFCDYGLFKKISDQVTVINRTDQVYMKEEFSLEKVVSQSASSVVGITAYKDLEKYPSRKNILPDPAQQVTGVVGTSDGIVITYLDPEIFSDAENWKYRVYTKDGSSYNAEFLGADSYSNLAFLKMSANNLTAISFSDSNSELPGEKIAVIGTNFGKSRARYAAGLLSSIDETYNLAGKTVSSSEKLEGIFKTDFNLEDVYAGGPAVDYSGRTIGILGYIEKNNAQNFFIIPANKVKAVLDKAIKKELGTNPVLGIYYLPLSKEYSGIKNISRNNGALIYSPSGQRGLAIISRTPADKAGIELGDIIISINGEEINFEKTLPDLLYKYKKGQEIELGIVRDGKDVKIKVRL